MKNFPNTTKRQLGYRLCILSGIIFWALLLFGCSSSEIVTAQSGTVIYHDANSLTVSYEAFKKRKKKGRYEYSPIPQRVVNAVYFPSGHTFKIGDRY